MLIFAGQGNPGPRHAGNRHNIGFMAVDEIARRWRFGAERSKFQSLVREGEIETADGAVKVLIMKPQTFYNETGRAIGEALKFYKVETTDLILFYDEIDLSPGRFRMKAGGGAAGNNGVRSVTAHIGPYFRRARLGVGHPGHKDRVMGHVLSDFHKVDQAWLAELLRAVAEAAPMLAAGDDERYQAEVMRLAPAEKADPRKAAKGED